MNIEKRSPRFGDYIDIVISEETTNGKTYSTERFKVIGFKEIENDYIYEVDGFEPNGAPSKFVEEKCDCIIVYSEKTDQVYTMEYDMDYYEIIPSGVFGVVEKNIETIKKFAEDNYFYEVIRNELMKEMANVQKDIADSYIFSGDDHIRDNSFGYLISKLQLFQMLSDYRDKIREDSWRTTTYNPFIAFDDEEGKLKQVIGQYSDFADDEIRQNMTYDLQQALIKYVKEKHLDNVYSFGNEVDFHSDIRKRKNSKIMCVIKKETDTTIWCNTYAYICICQDFIEINSLAEYYRTTILDGNKITAKELTKRFPLPEKKIENKLVESIFECLELYKNVFEKQKEEKYQEC